MKRPLFLAARRWLRDKLEYFSRKTPPPLAGVPDLGLNVTQVYPCGDSIQRVLTLALEKEFKGLTINSSTATASMGTCFAEEFSTYIKNNRGNYLYKEVNSFNSSANWGRVYTIPNLNQIIDYSLNPNYPTLIQNCKHGFLDPLRERSVGYFNCFEDASEQIRVHRLASAVVLKEAEVLVITLGQNEAWMDRQDNIVWGSIPASDIRNAYPNRFFPIEFSYAENLDRLERVLEALFSFNPRLKIILTVSPVAAYATFLNDNVVTQSFAGKCLLRSVVHDVIRKFSKNVFYFPSFELVFCENPMKFRADNRHVKFKTVDDIFSILSSVTS